jgi:heme/copper-type cytochrome/quinol oxidase subunit 2
MAKLSWFLPLAFAAMLLVFAPLPVSAAPPAERLIHVEASQFAYTPGVIHVEQGDTVTLELVSTDVVHGLYVDGYGLSVTADPGQSRRLTFKADRAGSFRFRCSITCGAMHPFMIGRLVVGANEWLWRALGLAGLAAAGILLAPRLKG